MKGAKQALGQVLSYKSDVFVSSIHTKHFFSIRNFKLYLIHESSVVQHDLFRASSSFSQFEVSRLFG
jgi:hypothetical protein